MSIDKELSNINPSTSTLLTIGVFDGVHLGHQHLLKHLYRRAKEQKLLSAVVTFRSHPKSVLTSGKPVVWLMELDERIRLIKQLGIDMVVALSFTREVKELSALDFTRRLYDRFNLKGIVIGPDFALGKDREGNTDKLRELGKDMGFTVEVMPPFTIAEGIVSSSEIRKALAEGEVARAARLLGRPFTLIGKTVTGTQRGRILGFPTINLELNPDMASPKDGVYATITVINGKSMPSVTNIGIRPTFGGGERIKETHILDFKGDIKDETIEVCFVERLRGEIKYSNEDELKAQIRLDVEKAKNILNKKNFNTGKM
jgi:riboflavin kinase/FMN adenylyltransferase